MSIKADRWTAGWARSCGLHLKFLEKKMSPAHKPRGVEFESTIVSIKASCINWNKKYG